MRVLVTGGSGYLGQFLVQALAQDHQVVSCWLSVEPNAQASPSVQLAQCDLTSHDSTEKLFQQFGPFDIAINTAALSQPGACQQDPDRARALNIPTCLLSALTSQRTSGGPLATLIHLSTDQVYNGKLPCSSEDTAPDPINEYGASKLEAEEEIARLWPQAVILRSSIIYGPPPPHHPVGRPLFLQFVEESLRLGKPCKFFSDEYRSPILVHDLVSAILFFAQSSASVPPSDTAATTHESSASPCPLAGIYNAGGPERLSRADMARAVAAHCGHGEGGVEEALSADVPRPAPSPLDISMDSQRLMAAVPFEFTTFATALRTVFPTT